MFGRTLSALPPQATWEFPAVEESSEAIFLSKIVSTIHLCSFRLINLNRTTQTCASLRRVLLVSLLDALGCFPTLVSALYGMRR
jgi:hypothetical protein